MRAIVIFLLIAVSLTGCVDDRPAGDEPSLLLAAPDAAKQIVEFKRGPDGAPGNSLNVGATWSPESGLLFAVDNPWSNEVYVAQPLASTSESTFPTNGAAQNLDAIWFEGTPVLAYADADFQLQVVVPESSGWRSRQLTPGMNEGSLHQNPDLERTGSDLLLGYHAVLDGQVPRFVLARITDWLGGFSPKPEMHSWDLPQLSPYPAGTVAADDSRILVAMNTDRTSIGLVAGTWEAVGAAEPHTIYHVAADAVPANAQLVPAIAQDAGGSAAALIQQVTLLGGLPLGGDGSLAVTREPEWGGQLTEAKSHDFASIIASGRSLYAPARDGFQYAIYELEPDGPARPVIKALCELGIVDYSPKPSFWALTDVDGVITLWHLPNASTPLPKGC